MTSAAGRIITTWPGHCFPLLLGAPPSGGGPGVGRRQVSPRFTAPLSPLGKVKWRSISYLEREAGEITILDPSFFPLNRGRSSLVLD